MLYEIMILSVLPWLAVIGGGGYLALRFIRAFERRGATQEELNALRSKVAELEGQLESMQEHVDRLSEGQDFTTRLLSNRSGS